MESQATSVEPGPRGEAGEETATEMILPLGDDQEELPSRFQRGLTLRAARFVRIDATFLPVAKGIRSALQKHGPRFIENQRQAAQPANQSPDQTMVHNRLVRRHGVIGRRCGRRLWITDQRAAVTYAGSVSGTRMLKIPPGPTRAKLVVCLRSSRTYRCGIVVPGKATRRWHIQR